MTTSAPSGPRGAPTSAPNAPTTNGTGQAPVPSGHPRSSDASGLGSARMAPDVRRRLTEMMIRLADGDRTAFEDAYVLLWPALLAFCKRVLVPADAEDAAQLALLKIFNRASTFQRDKDALTWAITIAVWEVRTIRKRHTRSRTTVLDTDDHVSPSPDPERMAADHELVEAAQTVLGSLSTDDRATLAATFAEEKPAGISNVTFRKRRERAIARLKEAWRRIHGN